MSTENPSESAAPAAEAAKEGTVKPDNQFNDLQPQTADASATDGGATASGGATPDNQFNDSAPKG